MNKAVCAFGAILIVVSVLIMTKSEMLSGQYANPPAELAIQTWPTSESPQGWIAQYASMYPCTCMGTVVLLLGLITLLLGSQMSKK